MAPGTLRSGSRLPLPLKILIVAAAALLLAAVAVFAALFAVSRSRSGDEADRLCATMTERGFFPARLFFSSEKIELSKFYLPPSEPDGPGVVQVQRAAGIGERHGQRVLGLDVAAPRPEQEQPRRDHPQAVGVRRVRGQRVQPVTIQCRAHLTQPVRQRADLPIQLLKQPVGVALVVVASPETMLVLTMISPSM